MNNIFCKQATISIFVSSRKDNFNDETFIHFLHIFANDPKPMQDLFWFKVSRGKSADVVQDRKPETVCLIARRALRVEYPIQSSHLSLPFFLTLVSTNSRLRKSKTRLQTIRRSLFVATSGDANFYRRLFHCILDSINVFKIIINSRYQFMKHFDIFC